MIRLLGALIIIVSLVLVSGCGKKGPPTLKEIQKTENNERTH